MATYNCQQSSQRGKTVFELITEARTIVCISSYRRPSRPSSSPPSTVKNGGRLELLQQIANHESPGTTKLYDRSEDEISLDEVERMAI